MNNLFSRLILYFKHVQYTKLKEINCRFQSYLDGGLDKDLIHPDNGENIARKRRKLGIDGGNASAIRDEFVFPPSTDLWK